jgi:hypothetical protein
MKYTVMILGLLILFSTSFAQFQQFAVARPDGTTYICPTFDSANNKAMDDDIIYLPGGTITGDKTITKRITLIGAGHYPDSTLYTGRTVFSGNIFLEKKCWLEGFEVYPNGISITNAISDSCSFVRIKCQGDLALAGSRGNIIDGSVISGRISGSYYTGGGCPITSNLLIKNSIIRNLIFVKSASVNNCLIFSSGNAVIQDVVFTNCIFYNLFQLDVSTYGCNITSTGNLGNNCIWYQAISLLGQYNYINNQPDTIMVNVPYSSFDYNFNYHLKPNSPYLTAGDYGGQIGIYGGAGSYKDGAVPNNPHIYFKQVASQTNNSGQLQIQFKVRTNN